MKSVCVTQGCLHHWSCSSNAARLVHSGLHCNAGLTAFKTFNPHVAYTHCACPLLLTLLLEQPLLCCCDAIARCLPIVQTEPFQACGGCC